jgi:UDP-GlcNAc:undecaprenyl-phosphate/decaprenyl-phosphate GlcNAc-1-phosphate transferase
LLTATLIVSLKPVALFARLIDRPDNRKLHHREIPLVGGIAIFIAFMASLAIARLHVESLIPFTIASALLVSVGVWDDRHGLSPRLRLFLQAAAVLYLMLAGDVIVRDLGTLSLAQGTFNLRFMIYPFTMFGVLAIINAFNLSDGLDGLAGGLFLVPLLAIAMITYSAGRYGYMEIALLLSSVVAGFLLFNLRTPWRRHASIFLGSAGSTFLGIALSWLLIELSQDQQRVIAPAAVPWFFAVPFLDMAFVMSRRMLRGRSPFQPDREHIHHVLLLAGYSVTQSVMILLGLSALCIMFGYWGAQFIAHDVLVVTAFIACACAYFMILGRTWKQMRFMGRPICRRRPMADRRAVDWQSVLGEADGSVIMRERRSGKDRRRDQRSLSDLDHAMPERV